MNSNIHNIIKGEYEKKQRLAFNNYMERRDEVYSKIPRIQEIDNQIQLLGVKYNKAILLESTSVDKAVTELESGMNALKKEKAQLLLAYGYAPDYLEVIYQCSLCNDTGFTGSLNAVEKCSCYKQQLINLSYSQSNLKLAEIENFSSFDESYYPEVVDENRYGLKVSPRQNILNIKERCTYFIENFTASDLKSLFFCGPTGVGKTFMCNCIATELLNKGRTVLYQTAPMLFESINEYKKQARNDDDFENFTYKNILEAELLIIDDLATESPTAARYAELLTILDTRSINNLSKPCKTIISTNINVKMLHEYYDERVVSRIIGNFDMFRFAGEDIRSVMKFSRK